MMRSAAAVFLATLVWSSTLPAQQPPDAAQQQDNVSQTNSDDQTTPLSDADVEDAQPLEMPVLPDEEVQDLLDQPAPVRDEAEIIIEPVQPGQRTDLSYGNVTRADVTQDPYRRAGKLFMTFGSGNSSCTAQNVGANDVILTAAHCVYNRAQQKFADDLSYRRAYADGGGEVFDWECVGIKTGWQGSDPYPWDFAFVKLRGNASGGALGLRTGLQIQEWISIGYPGNFENARYMQTVLGRKGTVGGGIAQMRDNPMTFGASGGAWIDGLYTVGVNSFLRGDPSTSTSLYGPVFNSQIVDLFHYVNNGCQ